MLVLSRKCGEKIVVPDSGIVLTVLEVRGPKVRLGIEAPPHVPVHRSEVWARIVQGKGDGPGEQSPAATP